jgi:hypothetical protein
MINSDNLYLLMANLMILFLHLKVLNKGISNFLICLSYVYKDWVSSFIRQSVRERLQEYLKRRVEPY